MFFLFSPSTGYKPARLAQSVERETLSLSRSNRHDYSVHLKVVGSTPTSGLRSFLFVPGVVAIRMLVVMWREWTERFFWTVPHHLVHHHLKSLPDTQAFCY